MVKFQCRRNAEFRRHWEAECRMPTALEIPGISPSIVHISYARQVGSQRQQLVLLVARLV